MNVFVTKYALTKGIKRISAAPVKRKPGTVVSADGEYFEHGEWWKTKTEAISMANYMRETEIDRLRKINF